MINQFKNDLKVHFPHDLVDALINAYAEIKTNFIINKWEPSELNGGKFVEATIRVLQFACNSGTYAPIGSSIRKMFNEIRRLEQSPSTIHDSYRLHIPRCLGAIYNIRNRRGVGHLSGDVNPNKADAYLIVSISEWILAELYRMNYNISLPEAESLVNNLISRKIELIVEVEGMKRILNPKMQIKDKILLLLYSLEYTPVLLADLLNHLRYKNKSYMKTKLLKDLDSRSLIEFNSAEEKIYLLPPGILYVEENYDNWEN